VVRHRLMQEFSMVFKKEDVEVVDLHTASPTTMYAVVKDGKLLYEKEKDSFLNWKFYAIKIWMETKWLRNLRNKKIINWADQA